MAFLRRMAVWAFGAPATIADSPEIQFSHVRPETPSPTGSSAGCEEELDPIDEQQLALRELPFFDQDTDVLEPVPGPGPQPLRGMSGFPAQQQQQAQARNATLASARLPNGKLGTKKKKHIFPLIYGREVYRVGYANAGWARGQTRYWCWGQLELQHACGRNTWSTGQSTAELWCNGLVCSESQWLAA